MAAGELYDTIGGGYGTARREDPRLAQVIWAALGDADTVLNVGAGTGNYEPPDRRVVAVEPRAVAALAADLESGAWAARHGDIMALDALDVGARLVVAETASS